MPLPRWSGVGALVSLALVVLLAVPGEARVDAGGGTIRPLPRRPPRCGAIDFEIYLPPGYDGSSARYPTLYLLHGRGDSMTAWTREKADLDRLIADGRSHRRSRDARCAVERARQLVRRLALPRQRPPRPPVETALTRDLVGYVDAHYRTVDDRPRERSAATRWAARARSATCSRTRTCSPRRSC